MTKRVLEIQAKLHRHGLLNDPYLEKTPVETRIYLLPKITVLREMMEKMHEEQQLRREEERRAKRE